MVPRPHVQDGNQEVDAARRRSVTLTVLFTDLVASTELLERLGDEAAKAVSDTHYRELHDRIEAAGGEELDWQGDGIVACFRSAADAVHCAIEVQQVSQQPIAGELLSIRVGLDCGEAMHQETGYFGKPLVVAERLCKLAEGGQILCSQVVATLLSGRAAYRFRKVGQLRLKGIRKAVPSYEVHYEAARQPVTLGETLDAIERQWFVGREDQLGAFRQWLTTDTPAPEILNVSGTGGSGKTWLLRAFARLAGDSGRPALLVDGADFRPTSEALIQALGAESEEQVVANLNRIRPVLLIDTFEQLGELSDFIQHQLLPRLDVSIKVVISGRHPLGQAWRRKGTWHGIVRPMRLGVFSREVGRSYLQRRGVVDGPLMNDLLAATARQPLALSLAADLVLQQRVPSLPEASEWRLIVRSLVEELMREVDDPEMLELLEAGAIVRQFDEGTLEAVSGRAPSAAAFDRFCRLSVTTPSTHGLMIHEDVRRIIRDDLRWRKPERFRELRLRALAYYRERMRSSSPDEREWLLAERFFLWENGLIQAMFFADENTGEVWLEPGRPETSQDAVEIWSKFFRNTTGVETSPEDREESVRLLAAALDYEGTRLRIARDQDAKALGFSLVLRLCRDSLRFIHSDRAMDRLIKALWPDPSKLPEKPDESEIFCILYLALADQKVETVRAALLRDLAGVFALSGAYLVTTALPEYSSILEALGFRKIDEARSTKWSEDSPTEGFLADLSGIGFEPWIEALMSGRRPPTTKEVQPVPGPANDPGGRRLTPREVEVVKLLSEGKSDREIAETLFISRRTAGTHVSNIFRKLNAKSRSKAAEQASQQDLL